MEYNKAQAFIEELSEAEFNEGNIYYAGIGLKEDSENVNFNQGDCFIEVGASPCEIERLEDEQPYNNLIESGDLIIVPSRPLRMSQDPARMISDLPTAGVCNLFYDDPASGKPIGITCAHTIPTPLPLSINFKLWLNSNVNFTSNVHVKHAYGLGAEDFATLNITALPALNIQNVSPVILPQKYIVNHFGRSTDLGRVELIGVTCTYDNHTFGNMVSIKHMNVLPGDSGSPVHITNSNHVLGLIVAENGQYTFANQLANSVVLPPPPTQLYFLH